MAKALETSAASTTLHIDQSPQTAEDNTTTSCFPGVQPNMQLELQTAPNETLVTVEMLTQWISNVGGSVRSKAAEHAHAIHADGGDNLWALRSLHANDLKRLGMKGIEARSIHTAIWHEVHPGIEHAAEVAVLSLYDGACSTVSYVGSLFGAAFQDIRRSP